VENAANSVDPVAAHAREELAHHYEQRPKTIRRYRQVLCIVLPHRPHAVRKERASPPCRRDRSPRSTARSCHPKRAEMKQLPAAPT